MMCKRISELNLPEPIAIIGAGVTGLSCFNLLNEAGITATVCDEREQLDTKTFDAFAGSVKFGSFSKQTFANFATVIASPGLDTRRACFADIQDTIITDVEIFARLTDKPIIGVTGSNGKSSVVSLLHDVTEKAGKDYLLCGNIGLPVLDAYRTGDENCDGYIVELSSYQLERAPSLSLQVGVWLNVSPDHLDRYNGYDDYIATKARIFKQSYHVVANLDDQHVMAYTHMHKHHYHDCTTFSQHHTNADYHCAKDTIYRNAQPIFSMQEFPQIGKHNADNVMAVFATARLLGIADDAVTQACKAFTPLPCRCVISGEKDGVLCINDSKGTNIGATVAAVNGIDKPIILLLGGQGKGQDFTELVSDVKDSVKQAIIFGQDAEIIAKACQSAIAYEVANDLTDAFARAVDAAETGDVILLSPACASFDMFPSYIARGHFFEQLVQEWKNSDI